MKKKGSFLDIFGTGGKDIFDDEEMDLVLDEPSSSPPKVTKKAAHVTLRMSKKAKKKLLKIHGKKGRKKSVIFKEALEQARRKRFRWGPNAFADHDCKASFNVILEAEELEAIEEALESTGTTKSRLISAVVLECTINE